LLQKIRGFGKEWIKELLQIYGIFIINLDENIYPRH